MLTSFINLVLLSKLKSGGDTGKKSINCSVKILREQASCNPAEILSALKRERILT